MSIYQLVYVVFAVCILISLLVVSGRNLWLLVQALRTRHYKIAAGATLAIAVLVSLFLVVSGAWFAYALARSQKTIVTDLLIALLTGVPYFAAAYGAWRFAAKLESRIKRDRERQVPETQAHDQTDS